MDPSKKGNKKNKNNISIKDFENLIEINKQLRQKYK